MSVPVLLRRAAELDLAAIEDWYASRREGLGIEFRAAVNEVIARISADPLMYPERYRANRRALLRRFPYVLWYRVYDPLESGAQPWLRCILTEAWRRRVREDQYPRCA